MKVHKKAKLIALLTAVGVVSGCALLPNNSNEVQAVDSVTKSYTEEAPVYEDRIGRHIYAGTGIGASRLEPDTSEVPGSDVNDRVEAGGQITLGMDLSRQVSLELHSADLGSAGVSPAGRINYHVHGLSALFYAGKQRHNWKRRGLTGYGRVGVGLLQNSAVGDVEFQKDNATHFLIGAGLEYMFPIGLGLRAEAISYEEDINYGQLALVYRTGKRPERKPVEIVKAPEPVPEPVVPVPAVKVIEPEPEPEPIVEAPSVCDQFDGTLDGVNFHTDSAKLTTEGLATINAAAEKLLSCEAVNVTVSAHTDSIGSESYNQALSERRAQSVVDQLISQGVAPHRLNAEAYGETQPIDTNSTREGRKRNRRVEVYAQ